MRTTIKANIGYLATPALFALHYFTRWSEWIYVYGVIAALSLLFMGFGLYTFTRLNVTQQLKFVRQTGVTAALTPGKIAFSLFNFTLALAYLLYAGFAGVAVLHTLNFMVAATFLFKRSRVLAA